jgi:phage terminase large subunit-like protein
MGEWSTALPDWKERLLSGRSLVPDLPLFNNEAERALRIFKRLRIPDVHGMPTMGEACGPWFFPIVAAFFGSYDPSNNRRMIQEYFWMIPKKNNKSSGGGAIMLTALIMNKRPQGEFQIVAPTKKIADISFKQAKDTIKADPYLLKLFQIQDGPRCITHRNTEAKLEIVAADTETVTGGKKLGSMIDEVHEFARKPRADAVFTEIRGGLASRPDGFLFQTTTQSKTPPSGVFATELQNARDVRDGKLDLPLLPILYELPTELAVEGGWKRREYWHLVNPNLGRSVDEDFLERELRKAERNGPAALALFASQHFNVQIGVALLSNSWPGAEFWRGNEKAGTSNVVKGLTLEQIIVDSEVIVVGIDGGGLDDLLGLAVLGRCAKTGKWLLWCKAWAHEIVKERRKEIAPKLEDLERAGDLTFVKVPGEELEELTAIVMQIEGSGKLAEKDAVGVDSYGVAEIVKALTASDDGLDPDRIVGVPQGWQMTGAIKTAERNLAGNTLLHGGQALMDFAVGNARVEPRGNAITITKQVSGSAKIDPLMASFNAVFLMGRNPASMREYQMFFA